MQLLQLHGLVPLAARALPGGPPHLLLQCGPLMALTSSFNSVSDFEDFTEPELLTWVSDHNAVLQTYCRDYPVLPTAPGAVFSGKSALRKSVSKQIDHHLACLAELHNLQEFLVQLQPVNSEPTIDNHEITNGVSFLISKQKKRRLRMNKKQIQTEFADEIRESIQTIASQTTLATRAREDRLLQVAALVAKDRVAALARLLEIYGPRAEEMGLSLTITGPLPAYSYVPPAAKEVCHVR